MRNTHPRLTSFPVKGPGIHGRCQWPTGAGVLGRYAFLSRENMVGRLILSQLQRVVGDRNLTNLVAIGASLTSGMDELDPLLDAYDVTRQYSGQGMLGCKSRMRSSWQGDLPNGIWPLLG